MSIPVITRPSLLEVVLDALTDAYYARRAEIEGCRDCTRTPAGICADHEADNALAFSYEEARKQIEHASDREVLALLNGKGEQS